MSNRKRTDAGTFVETVTLEAVLGVFEAVRGPVITSSDVAEQLDCTTEAARQKLTQLYERGDLDRRKTGRTVVWWLDDPSASTGADETTDERREKAGSDQSTADSKSGDEDKSEESTSGEPVLDRDLAETVRRSM